MARDLLRRPPILVSSLPPHKVSMRPGEPKMIVCPGCNRWLRPANGGLRRHAVVGIDGPWGYFESAECRQSGRRVFFDLGPAEWRVRLEVAVREAAQRRGGPVRRKAVPPVPLPVCRMAAAS